MEDFSNIINWDNFYKRSDLFKNNKPFKFGFVEDVFYPKFYDKLYNSFPKFDDTWKSYQDPGRLNKTKELKQPLEYLNRVTETSLSEEWNKFLRYMGTKEFTDNFSKYTGINLQFVRRASFVCSHKGDFALPHVDGYKNADGSIAYNLVVMIYFNKGWKKEDPGGTYICTEEDESTIIFEPYNLDNSLVCFEETENSFHGTRLNTTDRIRQAFALQIY